MKGRSGKQPPLFPFFALQEFTASHRLVCAWDPPSPDGCIPFEFQMQLFVSFTMHHFVVGLPSTGKHPYRSSDRISRHGNAI